MQNTFREIPRAIQSHLPFPPDAPNISRQRAVESRAFPFELISEISELESWRKEVNRPIYHLHKWWAQRLGSVFRSILIGLEESDPNAVLSAFYEPTRYTDVVVFDPFMGSGTTIGEALKLGMRAIGRDINHVATFAVQNALASHSKTDILKEYALLEQDVAPIIRALYTTTLPDKSVAEALYYFWVKVLPCPKCQQGVDLFSSYVFSRNAYPARRPEAQIVCPSCGAIQQGRYDATSMECVNCSVVFDPQHGPVHGQQATCPRCATSFAIAAVAQAQRRPPQHRMYAKLVLLPTGNKAYYQTTAADSDHYTQITQELTAHANLYPVALIEPGYNTDQVLNYGYQYWHEMFNARQLLALGLLGERIQRIEDSAIRSLFICLFSGVLEFNNMFASFKGEGTGAVRHMFSHHILKPERTPLEANVWGTPKSSGAFSTLFQSRLLRALQYQEKPFEIRPSVKSDKASGEKVFGLSASMTRQIVDTYNDFALTPDSVYISCGDSASTDMPDASVDLVVTDPPFFDNVHYSELADFFHVWQRHLLRHETDLPATTRAEAEVQSGDPVEFVAHLQCVLSECHRVLKKDGLLVFTYHHSRTEGWSAILEAITGAAFTITAVHPIKAEMSVATPKSQAREPIDLDVILVCRPSQRDASKAVDLEQMRQEALDAAAEQIRRLRACNRKLSRNDVRVVVMAQLLRVISQLPPGNGPTAVGLLDHNDDFIERCFQREYGGL